MVGIGNKQKKNYAENEHLRAHVGDSCVFILAERSKVNVSLIHSTESMHKPNESFQ